MESILEDHLKFVPISLPPSFSLMQVVGGEMTIRGVIGADAGKGQTGGSSKKGTWNGRWGHSNGVGNGE